jgi:hypothetical protein
MEAGRERGRGYFGEGSAMLRESEEKPPPPRNIHAARRRPHGCSSSSPQQRTTTHPSHRTKHPRRHRAISPDDYHRWAPTPPEAYKAMSLYLNRFSDEENRRPSSHPAAHLICASFSTDQKNSWCTDLMCRP